MAPVGTAEGRVVLSRHVGSVRMGFTDRSDGDMGHSGAPVTEVAPAVAARRRAVVDLPWTWLRQTHGAGVIRVEHPGQGAGQVADAAVTTSPGCVLAVLTADCAPVVLLGERRGVGVVHAGWRGLVSGVIEEAVQELLALGAGGVSAVLGPCIHAECYEFGDNDLGAVVRRVGDVARGTTATGRPALDLPAAVAARCRAAGVARFDDVDLCTACSSAHYSHRARRELARQATVAWIPA